LGEWGDTWPLFRIRGGIWISKAQINQIPNDDRADLWKIQALLEWYVEGLEF